MLPHAASARVVDDALASKFPPNRTSPLEVVVGAPAGSAKVRALAKQLSALPDVSAVAPAQPAGPSNALLAVAPVQAPLTGATKQLVRDIRAVNAPVYVGVAGQTAAYLDLEHSLGAHLPAILAVIVAATLIVLFLFTGSVVLPVKAVLMNFLNLSAVLGILVLIFQDGRIKEARDAGASDSEAIAVASSGRDGSSPPRQSCSQSRSARSLPPSSCSSRSSASGPRLRY